MIAALRGVLEAVGEDWVQIRVGGISFRLSVPASAISELGALGDEVHLHTHLIVREDGMSLCGFPNAESLRMFQQLLTVSGIGPRLALALLSTMGPYNLATAIASGDDVALSRVPGIGKKISARVVLELGEKLQKEGIPITRPGAPDGDMLAALMALGYTAQEARSALSGLNLPANTSMEERLRQALRRLGG
jgi:Holliday junction DNA helicase RuvA